MAAMITWPDAGMTSVCSLQFNLFLGQTSTASNHIWFRPNPRCHQTETLTPTPNQSRHSSTHQLAPQSQASFTHQQPNAATTGCGYDMALQQIRYRLPWLGTIWLILSSDHNKNHSSHEPDDTQVRTGLQRVMGLEEEHHRKNICNKRDLSLSNLTKQQVELIRICIQIHCVTILVICLAATVTAAPVVCCTRALNHPGQANPPGPHASYHTCRAIEARLHSLH